MDDPGHGPFVLPSALGRALSLVVVSAVIAVAGTGCDASANEAMQRVSEGVALASRGDQLEAVRRFEEAISLNPDNAQAHYFLGLLRLQHYHAPDQAADSLERAVELDPTNAEARYQYGVALERMERFADAGATFEEVVSLQPTHGGALYRLGVIADQSGEVRDAIDYYTRAIFADPYFPLAYNALGNIYIQYGRPQEAIQVLQNGIDNGIAEDMENRTGNALNRADLGRVYLDLGELDLAVSYLRQASELDPRSSSIPFNLGVALAQRYEDGGPTTDRDAAIDALSRARQQCNPAEEPARCNSIAAALRDLRTDEAGE